MGKSDNKPGVLVERVRAARRLAKGQYGLISAKQLDEVALYPTARSRLAKVGALTQVLPNVYKFRDVEDGEYHRILAGCLWAEGVAAFRTAGRLYGLDGCGHKKAKLPVELIAEARVGQRDGFVVRLRKLEKHQRTTKHNIPVTTLRRTLVDLADTLEEESFAFALESAWRRDLIDPHRWRYQLRKVKPLPGTLRKCLNDAMLRKRPMQSPLEVRLWRAMRARDLPIPITQFEFFDDRGHPLAPDFCFPKKRLIVEALGYDAHGGDREKFEEDAARLARLVAEGYSVFPVTSRMLDKDEEGVVEQIRRALDSRRNHRFPDVFYESFERPASESPFPEHHEP